MSDNKKKSQKALKDEYKGIVEGGIENESQAEKLVASFYSHIKAKEVYVTQDANVFTKKSPALIHAKSITNANQKGKIYIVPIK